MNIKLSPSQLLSQQELTISGSKSESNRLLILQELFPGLTILNLSDSDDVKAMQSALGSTQATLDIHHAGTTMRFLTAYYSLCTTKQLVLTGSSRMQERPIGILVDALRQLKADISYVNQPGYPPLRINGQLSKGGRICLPANISSQYITALLLIGTKLPNGIELELIGEITSLPYIQMTLSLLKELQVDCYFKDNVIVVKPLQQSPEKTFTVESDWSSASYFYSIVALSKPGFSLTLKSYKKDSLQGDSHVASIYEKLGVSTCFNPDYSIVLTKTHDDLQALELDLIQTPDLAQTIAVTCYGLGVKCVLTGLHTLKIKETDRLVALYNELSKLGAQVQITPNSLILEQHQGELVGNVAIHTYQDHRMAMAFAPLGLKVPIIINQAEVVSKSFVNFWDLLQLIGFQITIE
ncbi:3-phosphoshikimate 1-carboxyvinyltransferase [Myroides sp. LJL119]